MRTSKRNPIHPSNIGQIEAGVCSSHCEVKECSHTCSRKFPENQPYVLSNSAVELPYDNAFEPSDRTVDAAQNHTSSANNGIFDQFLKVVDEKPLEKVFLSENQPSIATLDDETHVMTENDEILDEVIEEDIDLSPANNNEINLSENQPLASISDVFDAMEEDDPPSTYNSVVLKLEIQRVEENELQQSLDSDTINESDANAEYQNNFADMDSSGRLIPE
ncbi:hypothetical protein Bhyg_02981, partial [Pseudolycoriella hygida]